ncbi:MAG: hypothetical protein AAFV53_00440 [Myxococcota bacterium]
MSGPTTTDRPWQPPRGKRHHDHVKHGYRVAYSYARHHHTEDDEVELLEWAAAYWHIDHAYHEFQMQVAQHCRCCPDCSEVPCSGVLTSGFCESWICVCGGDEDWEGEP